MKQTAVEWLVDKLTETQFLWLSDKPEMNELIDIVKQAKEMEKEQIIEAQSYAISKADMTNNRGYFDCEKYYNETFNK
jgi:hypothetical protein